MKQITILDFFEKAFPRSPDNDDTNYKIQPFPHASEQSSQRPRCKSSASRCVRTNPKSWRSGSNDVPLQFQLIFNGSVKPPIFRGVTQTIWEKSYILGCENPPRMQHITTRIPGSTFIVGSMESLLKTTASGKNSWCVFGKQHLVKEHPENRM